MSKYTLTKIEDFNCWYEVSLTQAESLFHDTRFTGELVFLYNDSDGAESVIETDEQLQNALAQAKLNNLSIAVHTVDAHAHPNLFTITQKKS